MNIFIVLLTHEHGEDVAARYKLAEAEKAAGELMLDTLDELEGEIDGDEEGDASLEKLKAHIKAGRIDDAMTLYNELYEEFVDSCDVHHICIKQTELK